MNEDCVYDLEVYPNIFTFCGLFRGQIYLYEISDRVNQIQELLQFLHFLRNINAELVGFNNVGYDYILIHELMINPYTFTYQKAFEISTKIIHGGKFGKPGIRPIRVYDRLIAQIDMMKVCHFDNANKRTSLKALQFAMRSESVEDLPFEIRPLTDEEKDLLCKYNIHDVTETKEFYDLNKHHVEMRREYVEDNVLKGDVLNYSDVKIGTEYLITRIGKNKCYSGSKPKQTFRESIAYKDVILKKIFFRTELFNNVFDWFKEQVIYVKKDGKPKLEVELAGLPFHFGVGGVHASADNKIFYSTEDRQIIDIDVAGMYVAVAIANKFAPEHLGQSYVEAYTQVKQDRARYAKGSSRNKALKLAGNGAYGNSNNPFSPFYDPKYTFSVTLNGQLQILQLVEVISLIPDVEVIQANTDGITVILPKEHVALFDMWCSDWESITGLELEHVEYKRMLIRDVNNYIAETTDGKLKRKGTYWYPLNIKEYDGWWNKDYSNLASKKAAERAMLDQWPIECAIKLITDKFDFMLRYKATGQSKVYIGDELQLKTVRYYVSKTGKPMKKISPPNGEIGQYKRKNKLTDEFFNQVMKEIGKDVWDDRVHTKNKSKYEMRETSIQSGWNVKQCNNAKDFDWNDLDWNFYIEEAKKIIIGG